MPTVEVVIKTTDQGSRQATQSLTNNLAGLAAKYISVGAVATTAYKVINDSIKTTMDYAKSVRDLSAASGQSAEKTSRFIQVLDDYEISSSDALTATRALTKQGLAPNIETLARLSDEYLSITDAQERNEFVLKNLGRSGLQWTNVLKQGSAALIAQGEAVNKNLILTDKEIQSTEEYRLAVDNLKDSWEGLKVSMGKSLMPDMTKGVWQLTNAKKIVDEMVRLRKEGFGGEAMGFVDLQNLQLQAEANVKANEAMGEYYRSTLQAKDGMNQYSDSLATAIERQEEFGRAGDDVYKGMKDNIGSLDKFASTVVTVADATRDYEIGLKEAKKQLDAHKITTKEYTDKVNELRSTYDEAAKGIIADLVLMKLTADGTFDTKDLDAYLGALKNLGIVKDQDVERTKAMYDSATAAANGWGGMKEGIDDVGKAADDVYKPLTRVSDNIYHTGQRADDATEGIGALEGASSEMADTMNRTANPAVAELKKNINGLPPSGTTWTYSFFIKVSGHAPKLPTETATVTPSQQGDIFGQHNYWAGGQMGDGWKVVGDMPGGGWGPYTEVISPTGYVYNAREARRLKAMGLLGDARNMYFGDGDQRLPFVTPAPVIHRGGGGGSGRAPTPSGYTGGGGITGNTGTGNIPSEAVASVAAFLAPALSAQTAVANTAQQQANAQQNKTNQLLTQLIATVSTNQGVGQAFQQVNSKFS